MKQNIILTIRLIWKIFFGTIALLSLYLIFFDEGFWEHIKNDFIISLLRDLGYKYSFEQMQAESWFSYISWYPYVAVIFILVLFFVFQFFCFSFTKKGFHRGLKFGHRIVCSQKHFFELWCYEKIQIDGVIPFYRMYVYKKNPLGLPFFVYANFLNLIIFIDENVSCDKMNPDARDNFRRLADKYRKLKKNHKILYWILNNV